MVSNQKTAIRRLLRAQRRKLAPTVVHAAGTAVHLQLGLLPFYRDAARIIMAYLPEENEISTAKIITESCNLGREVYLPRTAPVACFVRWRIGEQLVRGRSGMMEPCGGSQLPNNLSAVAFIPVVGWDETGMRLGRGGGYYDRILTHQNGGILRVGLAYEFQRCPEIPRDPWDVPLDYIITEQRVIRCGDRAEVQPEWL